MITVQSYSGGWNWHLPLYHMNSIRVLVLLLSVTAPAAFATLISQLVKTGSIFILAHDFGRGDVGCGGADFPELAGAHRRQTHACTISLFDLTAL